LPSIRTDGKSDANLEGTGEGKNEEASILAYQNKFQIWMKNCGGNDDKGGIQGNWEFEAVNEQICQVNPMPKCGQFLLLIHIDG
jgi:hypothetical protein